MSSMLAWREPVDSAELVLVVFSSERQLDVARRPILPRVAKLLVLEAVDVPLASPQDLDARQGRFDRNDCRGIDAGRDRQHPADTKDKVADKRNPVGLCVCQ